MRKLYNVIFPIWFILIMPPIVFLVIPSNFVIDSLVLIIGLKLLKITNWFDKYKKLIIRAWIIGFVVDIIGSLFLLITQFVPSNDYLYQNLVYPLAWNPFNSILSFIYVLVIVLLCGFLIYFINYKITFKKTDIDSKNRKVISLMLGVITAPYLFFLPTTLIYKQDNGLEKYRNTYIGDNVSVGNIINRIYSGNNYDHFNLNTKEEPFGLTIYYKNQNYGNIYKDIEQDAVILFNLIKNISYVEFQIDSKTYTFDSDYISNIYSKIKNIDLNEINKRYNNEYFQKYNYLGHIDKYDIFDTGTTCGNDKEIIYSDAKYDYFIECFNIDALYLVRDGVRIKLEKALNEQDISVDKLFNTNLEISKGVKK